MKRILYFVLLIAALLVYSSMSYAFGNLPDGWFDGKPVTPPEPPPVINPPLPDPVQTVTIEYGTRNVFSNEVNFHFSKPTSEYGRFNLNTAGKKYVIEGSYKDSSIEVRNSQTTKKLVVIAGPAYALKGASVAYPSTDPLTKPEAAPDPPPAPGEAVESKRFAHINHMSWHGQGTTIVFCAGDDVTSVTFHDTPFHYHMKDGTDKGPGREQWTNHYFQKKSETQTAGWFVWTIGGKKYQYYSDGRGDGLSDYVKHTGDCYKKYN